MVPRSTCSRIQGTTSSRIFSSGVVASKPRRRFDFVTSGVRSCTSYSKGLSETKRKGFFPPWTCFQIASASASTVVGTGVEMLKSSLSALGCSMHTRMPRARSPP